MPNYLVVAGGLLGGAFPWSIRAQALGSGTEGATQTAWDAGVLAWWNSAAYLAMMPTTNTLTYTYTSTMTANFKQSTVTRGTHNIAGGAAAAALPYQCANIMTFRTALAIRAGRGRWYLPALATTSLAATGYVLSAAALTNVQAAMNAMFTAIGSAFTVQILHRKSTLSGLTALSFSPVTGGDVSNKIAIQRRRGDKFVPTRATVVT
jgi:hypothetical protein